MSTSLIINRIMQHLGFTKDVEFANFLGISKQSVNNWRTRNSLDYQLVYTKCGFIDANWLLTGEGEMLREKSINSTLQGHPLAPELERIAKALEVLAPKDIATDAKILGVPYSITGIPGAGLKTENENVGNVEPAGKRGKGGSKKT